MKIAIVYDSFEGTEEYPGENIENEAPRRGRKKKPVTDRNAIAGALRELGHEPFEIAVDGRPQTLTKIVKSDADFFFNLTESYGGDDTKEAHFAAFLELVGKKFTGASPEASYLAMDKAIAKKIVRFHDLYTPYSAVVHRGRAEHVQDIRFPLIVKPASEDASKGIDVHSVVDSLKDLMERIDYIGAEFDCPVMLEEYIEGREIYAAVLGNERPEALPLVELDLSKLPEGMPHIAGYEVKFDTTHVAYKTTKSAPVHGMDDELRERIEQTALTAFRALKMRDYARADLRVTPEGRVYVIEVNPNPWLHPDSEFAMAAKESGRSYTQTIADILETAMRRYR